MVHQCLQCATRAQLIDAGFDGYFVMHSRGVYPVNPDGVPFSAAYVACTGDPIADLHEDLAAEQKARATYEHLMYMTDNPEIIDPLRFLRQREIVHYQRFGECLMIVQELMCNKKGNVRKEY